MKNLDQLRKKRDALNAEIKRVLGEEKIRKSKAWKKHRSSAIENRIKRFGGRDKFIAKHAGGRVVDTPLREGQCGYSAWMRSFESECKHLGVEANWELWRCQQNASCERYGVRVCGVHARFIDARKWSDWPNLLNSTKNTPSVHL